MMRIATDLAVLTGAPGVFNVGAVIDRNTNPAELAGVLTASVSRGIWSAGAATVQYRVVSDDVNPPGATPVVHAVGPLLPMPAQVGAPLVHVVLKTLIGAKRYLGLQQITGVAALIGGAINAEATLGSPTVPTPQGESGHTGEIRMLIDDNGYVVGYRNPITDSSVYDWLLPVQA